MIKANHKRIWVAFFDLYSNIRLKMHFRSIRYVGQHEERYLPVLLISNHFSWWDGFIQLRLNRRFFKRKYYVMMEEEQLKKHMFLSKGGTFSIEKGTRQTLESLKYSVDILKDKNNMLLIFPQGKIQSMYTKHFHFQSGLEYILRKTPDEIQLIFNINLIDYHSYKKPELTAYFAEHRVESEICRENIEKAFNRYAASCIEKQISL